MTELLQLLCGACAVSLNASFSLFVSVSVFRVTCFIELKFENLLTLTTSHAD